MDLNNNNNSLIQITGALPSYHNIECVFQPVLQFFYRATGKCYSVVALTAQHDAGTAIPETVLQCSEDMETV